MPEVIWYLPRLLEVSLAGNRIEELPDDIDELNTLHSIDLSRNELTTLPSSIGNLSYLREINLSDNHLTAIPQEFGKLRNLRHLNISVNDLENPPYEIINALQLLETLDIQLNNFYNFDPLQIKINLKQLLFGNVTQELTINSRNYSDNFDESGNCNSRFAHMLRSIVNLKLHSLSGHRILNVLGKCNPNLLQKLEISHMDALHGEELSEIFACISEFKNLESLNFTYNRLDRFPYDFTLTALKELDISGNGLSAVPEWVRNCKNLEELYLQNNVLLTLPSWLGELKNLRLLSCDNNELADLDASVYDLSNLQYLSLSGNRLDRISSKIDNIGRLSNLQTLLISGNRFKDLPEDLATLLNLKRLAIVDNAFESRPEVLSKLSYVAIETDIEDEPEELAETEYQSTAPKFPETQSLEQDSSAPIEISQATP